MLYHVCEACGERFNVLWAEGDENEHSMICKCPKCGTQYKTPQIDKKKLYMLMIPLAIACIPTYIFLRHYLDISALFSQVIGIGVFFILVAIIRINHIKKHKFEKIDESDIGNTNEQSSKHSK